MEDLFHENKFPTPKQVEEKAQGLDSAKAKTAIKNLRTNWNREIKNALDKGKWKR